MNFKSNTTLGKITFYISLFILAYIIVTTCIDFWCLSDNRNPKILIAYGYLMQYSKNFIIFIGLLAFFNFILAIITLFQKASNKKFSIISLIICSPFALSVIMGYLQGLMIRCEI